MDDDYHEQSLLKLFNIYYNDNKRYRDYYDLLVFDYFLKNILDNNRYNDYLEFYDVIKDNINGDINVIKLIHDCFILRIVEYVNNDEYDKAINMFDCGLSTLVNKYCKDYINNKFIRVLHKVVK